MADAQDLATANASAETTESCSSRRTAMGFRGAVEEMFGDEGVREVRLHLPADADAAFFDARSVGEKWVAERHLLTFMDAVLNGPCGRNRIKFADWGRLQIVRGFGRVKAAMLRVVTPQILASRAAALWREEHTRGVLVASSVPGRAVVTLTDHGFVTHHLAPAVLTESLRTVIAMSYFAKDVRGSFELLKGPRLAMTFTWS